MARTIVRNILYVFVLFILVVAIGFMLYFRQHEEKEETFVYEDVVVATEQRQNVQLEDPEELPKQDDNVVHDVGTGSYDKAEQLEDVISVLTEETEEKK